MYIELDKSFKYLKIVNRKPIDHTVHILKADPEEIDNARRKEYEALA